MKRERAGEREREPAAEQKVHDIIYVIMGHYKQKLEAKQKTKQKRKEKKKEKRKLGGGRSRRRRQAPSQTNREILDNATSIYRRQAA